MLKLVRTGPDPGRRHRGDALRRHARAAAPGGGEAGLRAPQEAARRGQGHRPRPPRPLDRGLLTLDSCVLELGLDGQLHSDDGIEQEQQDARRLHPEGAVVGDRGRPRSATPQRQGRPRGSRPRRGRGAGPLRNVTSPPRGTNPPRPSVAADRAGR